MNMRPRLTKVSSLALQQLLRIAAESDVDKDDLEKEDRLHRQNVCALLDELSPVSVAGIPNQTTLDCLLDARQPLSTFELLKNYFKQAAVTWQSEFRADAARVLYYAAIAAAIVCHGQVITSLDSTGQMDALTYLADVAWMPPALAGLFHEAGDSLRQNKVSKVPTLKDAE